MDDTKHPFKEPAFNDLLEETLTQASTGLTAGEMRLLVSGVSALRGAPTQKTLGTIESNALRALMDYVAYTQKADKEVVRALFLTKFNIQTPEHLPTDRYDTAVNFLVDLQVYKHLN
ncbi:MAG: hypothetical protein FWF24_00510 [Alphaproteobacteria bacterium]|nr:hypothetical protein [Alphaproteobacteria bacterium]